MREDFKKLYESISDPRKFPLDKWFVMPKNGLHYEFISWYKKFGLLDFSDGDTHFKVTGYPSSMINSIEESSSGKIASYGDFYIKSYNYSILKAQLEKDSNRERRQIPGTEREMSEISKRILLKEKQEKEIVNEKHQKEMDFIRRKREFMNQSFSNDDDL